MWSCQPRACMASSVVHRSTTTANLRGRGCDLAEAGNPLGLVFNVWNDVEQMHRLQDQPHISTRSQQFQARTSMLEGNERSHNYPDARRVQLADIGQIDQYLVGSIFNQLS